MYKMMVLVIYFVRASRQLQFKFRRPLSDERLLFVALVYGVANWFVPSQGRLLHEEEIRT